MDLFHPPRLDRRNERGVRVQGPVRGDLALEAELFGDPQSQQLVAAGQGLELQLLLDGEFLLKTLFALVECGHG